MTNDFVYNMSEINDEEIYRGWDEMVAEDGSIWETGYGDDDEWVDADDHDVGFYGEEEFA